VDRYSPAGIKIGPKHCSTTSAWKINFLRVIYCDSSKHKSALHSVREKLRESYSDQRARLVEELRMHPARANY
jgi:hypothetical protein